MTTFELVGFTADEERNLLAHVPLRHRQLGPAADQSRRRSRGKVWLVCVRAAAEFIGAATVPAPALLWAPAGQPFPALDDWWQFFHARLREDRPEDLAFLKRVARCRHVLRWAERVEEVPARWFAALTASPRCRPVEDLPFQPREKAHLARCKTCRAEAYRQLQRRARQRWRLLCPSVEALSGWLRGGADPRLEEHVRTCGMCQDTIHRLARMFEGAAVLESTAVQHKLALLAPPTLAWLEVATAWVEQQQKIFTAQKWALVWLAATLARSEKLPSAVRNFSRGDARPPNPADPAAVDEEMEKRLEEKLALERVLNLTGPTHQVRLFLEGDDVVVEARESPARPLQAFRLEFRRGGMPLVSVASACGRVRLTAADFRAALEGQADMLIIDREADAP